MGRDDCLRFEEAVASESALEEALLQHADTCPKCRALAEVRDLSAVPVTADEHDPFVQEVLATAADLAIRRATHWKRRRKKAALSVGISGYILAAATFLLGPSSYVNDHSAIARLFEAQVLAVPPPSVTSIMVVVMISAMWITVLAFITRSRWARAADS
jgi:hypothetical protein